MNNLISVVNLKKYFPLTKGFFATLFSKERKYIHAVDGISFDIKYREIFVLAGESGCGKTTTGKVILGLYKPTEGTVKFKGKDIFNLSKEEWREIRPKMQMIYQDPYESLNPRQKIYDIVAEPVRINHLCDSEDEVYDLVIRTLESVKLTPPEDFIYRYPHELSGGQRQRVAIARAIVLKPEFIVADEPVSMVDASMRASILDLLLSFRKDLNITFLYITHDLATARYAGDRIAIMYLGKIVEQGPIDVVIEDPQHPYTKSLISSIPDPDPRYTRSRERIKLKGEVPTPINPPSGCRLHPRCPYAMDICGREEPPEIEIGDGHMVKCWLYARR